VTRDRARKKAARARMAGTGEPYSVAARKTHAGQQPGDASVLREVIVRAKATLAAPSARIEFRIDTDVIRAEGQEQRHPGPVGRLVRFAARAAPLGMLGSTMSTSGGSRPKGARQTPT
jgi:hypothetical protein